MTGHRKISASWDADSHSTTGTQIHAQQLGLHPPNMRAMVGGFYHLEKYESQWEG
jgi:hypothetical protein